MTIVEFFKWFVDARNWRSPTVFLSETESEIDIVDETDENDFYDDYETFYKTEAKMTAECDVSDEKKVRVWAFNKAGTYGTFKTNDEGKSEFRGVTIDRQIAIAKKIFNFIWNGVDYYKEIEENPKDEVDDTNNSEKK